MSSIDAPTTSDSNPQKDIATRMTLLIRTVLQGKSDWKALEQMTGVNANKWRHMNAGITKPSLEMLAGLSRAFPGYAFWLATGLSNYAGEHSEPSQQFRIDLPPALAAAVKAKVDAGEYPNDGAAISAACTAYFS
jgi:hypothetical protein